MQPPSSHPPWQEQPGSLSPLWVSYCAWGQDPTHKLKTEPTKTGPDRQCFASPAPAMRIAIMPRTCTVRLHSPSCKTTGSKFNQVQKMVQILNMAGKGIDRAKGEVLVGSLQYFKLHGYQTVKWGKQETIPKSIYRQTKIAPQSRLIWSCVGATPSICNQNQMLCNALCSPARKIKASIKVTAWLIWLHLTPSTKTQQKSQLEPQIPYRSACLDQDMRMNTTHRAPIVHWLAYTERQTT